MLKLSKKVDYALIGLMHLARQDEGASSARELASIYGMPQDLLAKVLQKLTRSGLVVSRQGMKGGYSLARPAEAITVARVIEVVEGQPYLTQCFTDLGACEQFDTCNIKSPLQRLNDEVLLMLSRTTIARMCDEDHASFAGERTNVAAADDVQLPVIQD